MWGFRVYSPGHSCLGREDSSQRNSITSSPDMHQGSPTREKLYSCCTGRMPSLARPPNAGKDPKAGKAPHEGKPPQCREGSPKQGKPPPMQGRPPQCREGPLGDLVHRLRYDHPCAGPGGQCPALLTGCRLYFLRREKKHPASEAVHS